MSKIGNLRDKRNIIGLGNLMRSDNSDITDIDIEDYEKSIIKGEVDLKVEEAEYVKKFNHDMAYLQKSLNINIDNKDVNNYSDVNNDDSGSEYSDDVENNKLHNNHDNRHSDREYLVTDRYSDMGHSDKGHSDRGHSDRSHSDRSNSDSHQDNRSSSMHNDSSRYNESSQYESRGNNQYNGHPNNQYGTGIDTNYAYRTSLPNISNSQSMPLNNRFNDSHMQTMTLEQERRDHLSHIIGNINPNGMNSGYDLKEEREYDDKNVMLEEIDDLIEIAEDNRIDISRISKVDKDSTFAEVRDVYNKLRYKNDSQNYDQFANEIFMLFAHGAEYLFDGEKEWFGKRPDLTGWSDCVKTKLRRMKYEKTKLVRKIVDQYQIPPWMRVGMEIVPSAFTYTRNRKSAIRDNIASDKQFKSALNQLNSM